MDPQSSAAATNHHLLCVIRRHYLMAMQQRHLEVNECSVTQMSLHVRCAKMLLGELKKEEEVHLPDITLCDREW